MKKLPTMIMGAAMLVTAAAPFAQAAPAPTSYPDVPTSYRFYQEIETLSELGVIGGYPDGQFKPFGTVTRAEAAIMIGREVIDEEDINGTHTKFKDVNPNSKAAAYIKAATDNNIIQGFDATHFKPDAKLTREQAAILIGRGYGLTDSDNVTFVDVAKDSKAYPYIGKLVHAKITQGFPGNRFKPQQNVSRGEFAAFLDRADNYGPDIPEFQDIDIDPFEYVTNGKFDVNKYKQAYIAKGGDWNKYLQELEYATGMKLSDFIQAVQEQLDDPADDSEE